MAELPIAQAAAALGVSVDTIRRRVKAGVLSATTDARGHYVVEVPDAEMPEPALAGQGIALLKQQLEDAEQQRQHAQELLVEVRRQRDQLEQQLAVKDEQIQRTQQSEAELRMLLGSAQQLMRALPAGAEQEPTQHDAKGTEAAQQPPTRPWWRFWSDR